MALVSMVTIMKSLAGYTVVALIVSAIAHAQSQPPTGAARLSAHFKDVNRRVLEMAKDFPEDKYNFKLKPEMRTFGEVLVHVASGNVFAAKAGRGENVKWDEMDAKTIPTKPPSWRSSKKPSPTPTPP